MELGSSRTIVAMACDEAYLYPWAVSFVSAAIHSSSPLEVWFGLATDWKQRLAEESLAQVLSLVEASGSSAQPVEVSVDTSGLPSSSYISPTAFVKLGLFDLCPSDSTMVWLDADLIARAPWGSVLDLAGDHAISGNYESNPTFESEWPAGDGDWYVNTGVVLVRGGSWQAQFAEQWHGYLGDYTANGFRYMDQDVLNALVRNRWNHIPDTYNYRPIHATSWTDPTIVHYSGRYKPWMSTPVQNTLLRGVWRPAFDAYYAAEAAFTEFLDDVASDEQRRFWRGVRRATRGRMDGRAWRYYARILRQGALGLD